MTEITKDHVEWAIVDRLRLMLEEIPHQEFSVTQTYSHFSSVLCWVMQRVRINTIDSKYDRHARELLETLEGSQIIGDPWFIHVAPFKRIERIGGATVHVPAPRGFETHNAKRFLVNLRDAAAHGDARNVEPFNTSGRLNGFTFSCAELEGRGSNRKTTWSGEITLTKGDMRRIGVQLAKLYCDAIQHGESHRRDGSFGSNAASIKEVAA